MRKGLVVKDTKNKILYISKLYCGKTHNYALLKSEFPPESSCFEKLELEVDLGFQGIESDYKCLKVHIPHKRKRKKKGECNELLEEEKAHNKALSSSHVDVEPSIGQMKNCRLIHQVVRIRNKRLLDDLVLLSGGIANFKNYLKH